MVEIIEELMAGAMKGIESVDWFKMNAKLQQKKNRLRKMLKEKGVLKKGAKNSYDNYSYFSEAQYKQLFTELFSECGLELSFTELSYDTFTAEGKQSNGRLPKLKFRLTDIDTGFSESSVITGEGIDKGDKAGYKAYTGALKYFLANTFMVATGDDPEKDSPSVKVDEAGFADIEYHRNISKKEQQVLKNMIESKGYKVEDIIKIPLEEVTSEQYVQAVQTIEKMKDKEGKK